MASGTQAVEPPPYAQHHTRRHGARPKPASAPTGLHRRSDGPGRHASGAAAARVRAGPGGMVGPAGRCALVVAVPAQGQLVGFGRSARHPGRLERPGVGRDRRDRPAVRLRWTHRLRRQRGLPVAAGRGLPTPQRPQSAGRRRAGGQGRASGRERQPGRPGALGAHVQWPGLCGRRDPPPRWFAGMAGRVPEQPLETGRRDAGAHRRRARRARAARCLAPCGTRSPSG